MTLVKVRHNSLRSLIIFTIGCYFLSVSTSAQDITVQKENFQTVINGKNTDLYVLENKNGMKVAITNYGGRIVSWLAPDKNGDFDDVVLGFESLEEYMNAGSSSYGATIGRYANRIANGQFQLNNQTYQLEINNPPNHLHGGSDGFYHKVFEAEQLDKKNLRLTYISQDGEAGYPGRLNLMVQFILTENNALRIEYTATTDKPTVLNITNHAFFNLKGLGLGEVSNHELMINADHFTPVDETGIPTGEIISVSDSPFDFREQKQIGIHQSDDHQQLKYVRGYDHNFVLNKSHDGQLSLAAKVYEPDSGRLLEVHTTEPGIQFYGGNFLNGSDVGKEGNAHEFRYGFCLEPQHFPDAPNQPIFPSTKLTPEDIFHSISFYKMSTEN